MARGDVVLLFWLTEKTRRHRRPLFTPGGLMWGCQGQNKARAFVSACFERMCGTAKDGILCNANTTLILLLLPCVFMYPSLNLRFLLPCLLSLGFFASSLSGLVCLVLTERPTDLCKTITRLSGTDFSFLNFACAPDAPLHLRVCSAFTSTSLNF